MRILLLNKQGTDKLKEMDMVGSIGDLKLSEQLIVKKLKNTERDNEVLKLLAVTLNNIACYYKRSNKFHTALRYQARVLQIEKHVFNKNVSLAATYLNIGAILSEMKKHFEALKFLRKANELFLAEKERMVYEDDDDNTEKDERSIMSFKTNFIISYYNIAFQLQRIARREEALEVVTQGKQFSEMELGVDHQLTYELAKLSEQLENELQRNRLRKNKMTVDGKAVGLKNEKYNEYKDWMSANKVCGMEYSLDDTGKHFLKFNRFKNEVSIETEPALKKPQQAKGKIDRFRKQVQREKPSGHTDVTSFKQPPIRSTSHNSSRSNSILLDRDTKGNKKRDQSFNKTEPVRGDSKNRSRKAWDNDTNDIRKNREAKNHSSSMHSEKENFEKTYGEANQGKLFV